MECLLIQFEPPVPWSNFLLGQDCGLSLVGISSRFTTGRDPMTGNDMDVFGISFARICLYIGDI